MNRFFFFIVFLLTTLAAQAEPKKVYADVSGDLFHAGHVAFFKKARELGDELIIGVLSDEDIASYKRTPVLTQEERAAIIGACRYVDHIIESPPLQPTKEWLQEHGFSVVVHGDDFLHTENLEQYEAAIELGIFTTVPYTKGISTTEIIERIKTRDDL